MAKKRLSDDEREEVKNKRGRLITVYLTMILGIIGYIAADLTKFFTTANKQIGEISGTLTTFKDNTEEVLKELKTDVKDYRVGKAEQKAKDKEQDKRLENIEEKIK